MCVFSKPLLLASGQLAWAMRWCRPAAVFQGHKRKVQLVQPETPALPSDNMARVEAYLEVSNELIFTQSSTTISNSVPVFSEVKRQLRNQFEATAKRNARITPGFALDGGVHRVGSE